MTGRGATESVVEHAALAWLESLGWSIKHGIQIAPGEPGAERADYAQSALTASNEVGFFSPVGVRRGGPR